jgi:hypothetical protein
VQDDLCPEHVGQRGDLDQVEPGQQTIGSLDLMGAGNCVTTSDQRLRARPTPADRAASPPTRRRERRRTDVAEFIVTSRIGEGRKGHE